MYGIIIDMDIQSYLLYILNFLNTRIVPFLMVLALLFFIWNTFRFFIWHGDEEDGRESAKSLAIWGITAFAVIATIWGLVNLGLQVFGINNAQRPLQGDYIMIKGGGTGNPSSGPGNSGLNNSVNTGSQTTTISPGTGPNDQVTPIGSGMDDNLP